MRLFAGIACVAALLPGVIACGDDESAGDFASGDIVFATVYNLSGSQAVLDVPSANGSSLAVDEINAAGGVLDRDISLVAVEGESDAAALAGKTEEVLEDNPDIVALVGLSDTDMVLEAAPVAAEAERVFLTSGATSPALPEQVPEYLFLACFGDNVQAAAGAEWAYNELGARSVLVLYDPNESYPQLLQRYFRERFEALGGTVTSADAIQPRADNVGLPDAGDVDMVFLSVETAEDAARVIPMLREGGYTGPILGGDGYDAASVWADHAAIEGVYFTTHVYLGADNPNPKVGEFIEAYEAAHEGEPPTGFAALGYDAIGLLAAAIEAAGEATPAAVLDALAGIDGYEGVTGTISFPGDSRIPTKSVALLEVAAGQQQFVAEVVPESVPQP